MLGGDNMDLALAHLAEQRLAAASAVGGPLSQLVQRCRMAKSSCWPPARRSGSPSRCSAAAPGGSARRAPSS